MVAENIHTPTEGYWKYQEGGGGGLEVEICFPEGGKQFVTNEAMGDSRKYPYLYHGRLLGFLKGRGVL